MDTLPNEIIEIIFSKLYIHDVIAVKQTCKRYAAYKPRHIKIGQLYDYQIKHIADAVTLYVHVCYVTSFKDFTRLKRLTVVHYAEVGNVFWFPSSLKYIDIQISVCNTFYFPKMKLNMLKLGKIYNGTTQITLPDAKTAELDSGSFKLSKNRKIDLVVIMHEYPADNRHDIFANTLILDEQVRVLTATGVNNNVCTIDISDVTNLGLHNYAKHIGNAANVNTNILVYGGGKCIMSQHCAKKVKNCTNKSTLII